MTEPKRPGLDEAIEAAARELARHEPIAGGRGCHCLPTPGGFWVGLPSWDEHLALAVAPVVAAAVRDDERAKVLGWAADECHRVARQLAMPWPRRQEPNTATNGYSPLWDLEQLFREQSRTDGTKP